MDQDFTQSRFYVKVIWKRVAAQPDIFDLISVHRYWLVKRNLRSARKWVGDLFKVYSMQWSYERGLSQPDILSRISMHRYWQIS
jgi:hypothetical protein